MPKAGRLGDKAKAPVDAHGCTACPHSVEGPAITGSSNVFINGKPALRKGDKGIHAVCCGTNTWEAASGSSTVFINGRPAVRMGDQTKHCGGPGQIVEGSDNVFIGDRGGGQGKEVKAQKPKVFSG